MLVHRKLVMATGVAVAVAGLTGCQQKLVTAVSVSGDGSVTISETSAVVYDQSAGNLRSSNRIRPRCWPQPRRTPRATSGLA